MHPAARLYQWLARAFPESFRRVHGAEVDWMTAGLIDDAARREGWRGLAFLLPRLFADLIGRIVAEHGAELAQDLRWTLRSLRKSKLFAAVATLSLGLSIAMVTSSYSQVETLALGAVPGVAAPGDLWRLQSPTSYPVYRLLSREPGAFSEAAAFHAPVPFAWRSAGDREPRRLWGQLISPGYFALLGVKPAAGRLLNGDDHGPVAVISHRLWREAFGGGPSIIGHTIQLNRTAVTVVGVAAEGFLGASPMLAASDLFLPVDVPEALAPDLAHGGLENRRLALFNIVGRLAPGVVPGQAQAVLDGRVRALEQQFSDPGRERSGRRVTLLPGGRLMPVRDEDMGMMLALPVALCGLMLWIACANVATVLLARGVERRREIAVRLALGAGRGRIVRQLLTESTVLALAGGVVGLLFTWWSFTLVDLYRPVLPGYVQLEYLRISPMAVAITGVVSLATGILFGLAPALQATNTDVTPALKGNLQRLPRFRWWSTRNLLVVQQVAASLSLLMITGIVAVGLERNVNNDLGYDPRHLWQFSIDPRREGYSVDATQQLAARLRDRLLAEPGVSAAGVGVTSPASFDGSTKKVSTEADLEDELAQAATRIDVAPVGLGYLDAVGMRLRRGRLFSKDDAGRPRVVINATLAARQFPRTDPVGRWLTVDGQKQEVIGVVGDIQATVLLNLAQSKAYRLMAPSDFAAPGPTGLTLLVRAQPGVDTAATVRRVLRREDAALAIFHPSTVMEELDHQRAVAKVASYTYAGIGAFGLLLAAIGLAGVTAYSVVQRTKEIGIRVALGARPASVLRLVMREGLWMTLIGAGAGLGAAFALVRLIGAQIEGMQQVSQTSIDDPLISLGGPVLLTLLSLLACYLPARRSVRIEPMRTLRED